MRQAIVLAGVGLGETSPNPSVGVLIIDPLTGEIIARGRTQAGGRPHAETEALGRAAQRAKGATLYTTLEPCSHVGRTPPCADAIIAGGIARVVMALSDPDPRVAGRGRARLAAAGIQVQDQLPGDVIAAAREVTLGHILRICERRPMVELKLAVTPHGHAPAGHACAPTFITNELSRQRGHLMRARADAILVGSATVRADDPELTCRLPGMSARSPLRVILARTLEISPTSKLVQTARTVPVLAYHAGVGGSARQLALEAAGVICVRVPALADGLWLPAVLEDLASRGVTRLLVEGGPRVWQAFLKGRLVDRLSVFVAGVSDSYLSPDAALAPYMPAGHHDFVLTTVRDLGATDRLFTLTRAKSKE